VTRRARDGQHGDFPLCLAPTELRSSHTRRFPELAAIAKLSARTLVLDGEVPVYDQQLRSRFDWLPEFLHAAIEIAAPPVFSEEAVEGPVAARRRAPRSRWWAGTMTAAMWPRQRAAA
jgi:hypothetical protein